MNECMLHIRIEYKLNMNNDNDVGNISSYHRCW